MPVASRLRCSATTSISGTWSGLSVANIEYDDTSYSTTTPAQNATPASSVDITFPALLTSEINEGATINSVTVRMIYRASSVAGAVAPFAQIRGNNNGTLMGSAATAHTPAAANADQDFSATYMPGAAGFPTPADLMAGNVKVRCYAGRTGATSYTFSLDWASLTIDYTPGGTATRQIGSAGFYVDLKAVTERRVGAINLNVDYIPRVGGPVELVETISQPTSVSLRMPSASLVRSVTVAPSVSLKRAFGVVLGTLSQAQTLGLTLASVIDIVVSATQVQAVSLVKAISLRRRITVSQMVRVPSGMSRLVTATVSTAASLRKAYVIAGAATQAQAASVVLGHGYQRTLSVAQATSVQLRKGLHFMRGLLVQTSVALPGQSQRVVSATQSTSVRLLQQIRLNRAVTSTQAAQTTVLPATLRLVSTVQARSLDLGRQISLVRALAQSTAAILGGTFSLGRTAQAVTVLHRQVSVTRTLTIGQAQSVSLELVELALQYEVLVTASVSQHVALGTSATGAPAKSFAARERDAVFVIDGRQSTFTPAGRRGRFTVGVR